MKNKKKYRIVQKVKRPGTNKEYIVVSKFDRNTRRKKTEVFEYEKDLYMLLRHDNIYFSIGDNGRIYIQATKKMTLARFIQLYRTEFYRFKGLNNGYDLFMDSLQELTGRHKEKDCIHINSHTWNDSQYNTMFADSIVNRQMGTYINNFMGAYDVFCIGYEGKILLQMQHNAMYYYYSFDNEYSFLDFQQIMLGKRELTGHVTITGVTSPKEEYEENKEDTGSNKALSRADTIESFWEYLDKKDKLIQAYTTDRNQFKAWQGVPNRPTIDDLLKAVYDNMGIDKGLPCFIYAEELI